MTNMHRQSSSLQKRRKRCRRRFLQSAAQPEQELQSKDAAVDVPPSLPLEVRAGQASSSAGNVEMDDLGLAVPVTPPREYVMVESPRSAPATRPTETEGDEVLKKQRVEDAKKQRINQMRMDYEKRLSAVKIEYKEYFTMDEYETELDVDKEMEDEDEMEKNLLSCMEFLRESGLIHQLIRHRCHLRAGLMSWLTRWKFNCVRCRF